MSYDIYFVENENIVCENDKNDNTQRQKFLSDLCHGLITQSDDISPASEKYSIDLNADSFQCVILEFHSESEVNYYYLLSASEQICSLLKKYENVLYFFSDSKTLNMIVKNRTTSFCRQLCREIIQSIQTMSTELFCVCSIGSLQQESSNLPQSLSEAQFVLSLKANSMGHSISCIEDVNVSLLSQNFIINSEKNSLLSIFKFGTPEELDSYLEKLAIKLETQNLCSINFVYWGIQIISLVKEFAEEMGSDFSDIVKDDHLFCASSFLGSNAVNQFIEAIRSIFLDVFHFRELQKNNKYGNIIAEAKIYIEKQCHSPNLSLVDVAAHVNISPAYFSQLFHQETGESFIDFLTSARMRKARYLLSHTATRASEIALECGYNDPNYFSKVFKKLFGVSPREYRSGSKNKNKKNNS